MTEEALQQLCEELSLQYFKRPFKHRVTYNRRLRSTGGRYLLRTGNIEINPKVEITLGMETLIGVLKHELCHYHLHQQGRGYRHQDDDFKRLLQQVGGIRYVERIEPPKYLYRCTQCGQEIPRMRPLIIKNYRCGKCGGPLEAVPSSYQSK